MMTGTAILIGTPEACCQLEQQLDVLADRPVTLGWITPAPPPGKANAETPKAETPKSELGTLVQEIRGDPILGSLDELEPVFARRTPSLALVSFPGVMTELIASVRTRLRRIGVPDRFMPMLADQLAGVGPRSTFEIDPAELIGRAAREPDERTLRALIAGRRLLITGAGGSIGSELARIASRHNPELLVLMDRSENALFEIDRQIARFAPEVDRRAVLHDVVDADGTLDHCRTFAPEIIFHAAAHKHVPMMEDHPGAAVDNNLFGTQSIADAADAVGVERFVMISTDKAVNPTSIMGATKRLAELYVQHLNRRSETAFAIVRFGNVLASAGSVIEIWNRQLADGGPITVTDPRMTRYFMTIPEAAGLVIESAGLVDPDAREGEVFLLDMGEPIAIVTMAERFIALHGLAPQHAEMMPASRGVRGVMPIVFTGARPGEKLHEELAFDAECMQPTRHPRINCWLLPPPEEMLIRDMLFALAPESRAADAATIRRLIHRAAASAPSKAVAGISS